MAVNYSRWRHVCDASSGMEAGLHWQACSITALAGWRGSARNEKQMGMSLWPSFFASRIMTKSAVNTALIRAEIVAAARRAAIASIARSRNQPIIIGAGKTEITSAASPRRATSALVEIMWRTRSIRASCIAASSAPHPCLYQRSAASAPVVASARESLWAGRVAATK